MPIQMKKEEILSILQNRLDKLHLLMTYFDELKFEEEDLRLNVLEKIQYIIKLIQYFDSFSSEEINISLTEFIKIR